MQLQSYAFRLSSLVAGVAMLAFSGWVGADPPSRVARLGYASGEVSFSPAGGDDWVQASINRPLTTGDRLWSDNGSRAELQIGGATVRMGEYSSVAILNLDDQNAQVQLTQGRLNVRVRHLDRGQVLEIDTPNLAFTVREPADYRIEVDRDGRATTVVVRRGQGEAYGEGAAYVIDSQQAYRFSGTDLSDYEYVDTPRTDDFDRWSNERDRRYDTSASARYVSRDVVGYDDLDAYGNWRRDSTYGNVWIPSRVRAGWAPYSDGHWAWIDPWGWTWVDDAPWGFAVSHYGRWANLGGTWGWVPGPMQTRAYYAPALVVFVGGSNFQLSISSGHVGGVAWFPLGPREVYQPSYRVTRGYFENVNRSNTIVNNTVINNYYNSNVTNVVYANRQVPGAVVAVPRTAFVQSQPVSRAAVRVERESAVSGPVGFVAPVAPSATSVRGDAAEHNRPPARVVERPVVARTPPPPAPVGFAVQQRQLATQPGKPLDDTARKQLKRESAAPAPTVKVVAPTGTAQPTERPPPSPQQPGQHGKSDQRGRPDQRGQPVAPPPAPATQPTPVPRAEPPQQVMPPVPVAPPPDQHGKSDQRGRPDQRGQPVAPPPAPVTQPAPVPQAVPPVPVAPPPDQHGKSDQRGRPDQRGQPVAPPPAAPAPQPAQEQQAPPAQSVAPGTAAPTAEPEAVPDAQKGKGKKKKASEEPVPVPVPVPENSN
jgi:hypothetical protein